MDQDSEWKRFMRKIKKEHPELKSYRARLKYATPIWIKEHPKVEPWRYKHTRHDLERVRKENPKLSHAECVKLVSSKGDEKKKKKENPDTNKMPRRKKETKETPTETPKETKEDIKEILTKEDEPKKEKEPKPLTEWQKIVQATAKKYPPEYLKEHGGLFKVASQERKKMKKKK
jgi:hypothetical protein